MNKKERKKALKALEQIAKNIIETDKEFLGKLAKC